MTKPFTPARCLVLLVTGLPLVACEPGEPRVPSLHANPVSVAYWKEVDRFLVGMFVGGEIHSVSATSAHVMVLKPASARGHQAALRLAVDEVRSRLWVLDFGVAYVYRLSAEGSRIGTLFARIPVGVDSRIRKGSCFPETVLDEAGRALISSNARPTLAAIALEDGPNPKASVRYIELEAAERDRDLTGVTAIAVLPEEDALIVADARTGTLWRVARASWRATRIVIPDGVVAACALLRIAGGRGEGVTLALSRGFSGGLQIVELSKEGMAGASAGR